MTQEAGQGGIARVSRLLWIVLQEMSSGQAGMLNMPRNGRIAPTTIDKLRFAAAWLNAHTSEQFDWVIYDHLGIARIQGLVPKSLARPYGVFIHSVEAWNELSPARKTILRNASVRIANSHYTSRRVLAAHPDIGEIHVCHLSLPPANGSVTSSFDSKSTLSEGESALLSRIKADSVLIVGRMLSTERHKGHDALIQAWFEVRRRIASAQLVVVGGGDDCARLRQKARDNHVGESVVFTGQVSERMLEEIYKRVAFFAMPSSGEGFGLVYLEAMRHSLPCIASVHDAASEIVEHGVSGVLVSQSDTSGLATEIIWLLADAEKRKAMGAAGFKRLQQDFSFQSFKSRLVPILNQAF